MFALDALASGVPSPLWLTQSQSLSRTIANKATCPRLKLQVKRRNWIFWDGEFIKGVQEEVPCRPENRQASQVLRHCIYHGQQHWVRRTKADDSSSIWVAGAWAVQSLSSMCISWNGHCHSTYARLKGGAIPKLVKYFYYVKFTMPLVMLQLFLKCYQLSEFHDNVFYFRKWSGYFNSF